MGFIVFEEEAFNYLDAQLENFVKRMDRIRERSEDKTLNKKSAAFDFQFRYNVRDAVNGAADGKVPTPRT